MKKLAAMMVMLAMMLVAAAPAAAQTVVNEGGNFVGNDIAVANANVSFNNGGFGFDGGPFIGNFSFGDDRANFVGNDIAVANANVEFTSFGGFFF